MEYKNTLNLPKTGFAMKADLPKREPGFLKLWQEADIYRLIRDKSKGKDRYILHDGPPYANGDIHIGHALNKTLKDIIVKYKNMRGFDSAYVPGWDCHGLPVEHQLFKELKINKYQIPQLEFRQKAYAYAMRYVSLQKEQFKRLGVFGDWQKPYLTLDASYEEEIVRSLGALTEKGYIYRGLKPVNWCFKCETALAEAEVEYDAHTSPSVYVKFELEERKDFSKDTYLVIWTTTPWTLLANVAVAVHPEFIYSYIKTDKGNLIIAEVRAQALERMGIEKYEIIRRFKGKELEGALYAHPFGLRKGKVVLADYVSSEEGTGLVHTAPGHGAEDYLTGLKYKLEIVMPVDAKGNFDQSAKEFQGLNVYKANDLIIDKLGRSGLLLLAEKLQHSYPHCWRCKNPVIFRATKQWFLNIDHQGLRGRLLEAINKDIQWIPVSGKERISSMVELRPDWCLSRQRYWGVPIPAVVCNNCRQEFLEPKIIDKFAGFVSTEGTDSWFSRDIADFLPDDFICPDCKGSSFSKGTDILDVWFDSGVSHQAVLKKREELGREIPCALYLEGSDQHRGWFQSSLIPAVCIDGKPPYQSVLTHGFVVDGTGRKMSKSLGNVVSPHDIIKDYGADILRMWVASSDYNEDIRISKEILTRLSEAYRKIRNTVRFILSNLYDFDPESDKVKYGDLKKIDKWILFGLQRSLLERVNQAYDSFEFYKVYQAIYEFCNIQLSTYYLDIIKGRLYTCAPGSRQRRAAQTAIFEVLNVLVRMLAPILPFTAEEIWQIMPKEEKDKRVISVHLSDWPKRDPDLSQDELFSQGKDIFEELKSVIELVPKVNERLEQLRSKGEIGSSFDAKIILLTNHRNRYTFLSNLKDDLIEFFKVSQVMIEEAAGLPEDDVAIEVLRAEGKKCARCWNYSQDVGSNEEHPLICAKCFSAIGGR
ncbi:MAG: isoleucine--tRNA ligase [Candidatus Omnitrophica bacterium]|nr:isoleucine--tRNA ligase [Candidatus Omnitrophota bacterium]